VERRREHIGQEDTRFKYKRGKVPLAENQDGSSGLNPELNPIGNALGLAKENRTWPIVRFVVTEVLAYWQLQER
jgi:hypothetical protein